MRADAEAALAFSAHLRAASMLASVSNLWHITTMPCTVLPTGDKEVSHPNRRSGNAFKAVSPARRPNHEEE